jgi:hypothetical protein
LHFLKNLLIYDVWLKMGQIPSNFTKIINGFNGRIFRAI